MRAAVGPDAGGGDGADDRRAAAADLDPALGGDLRVRLADDAARDVEGLGEHAGGGQAGARRRAAAGDRGADRVLELRAQGLGRAAVERGEQLQSGSVHRRRSGSVGRATRTVPCSAMSDMPELRPGPPWAMEEMILAEPGLVAPILASSAALEAAESIRETETVVVTGCGTSEHAAMAGAALLGGARARDAFEASLDPQGEGVLIAVSHEAGTAATLAAMRDHRRAHDPDHGQPGRRDGRRSHDPHAARRHLLVPHRRLRLAAARADRDRGRRRRDHLHAGHRGHAGPARRASESRRGPSSAASA